MFNIILILFFQEVFLSKIFKIKESYPNKNTSQSLYLQTTGEKEKEKEREIKILENLLHKKLNNEYMDKLSILLYKSQTKSNYPQKRNNLKKTIYKYDDKNELNLTLPKLNVNDKNKNIANKYFKTETTEYTSKKITNNHSQRQFEGEDILDENIKEILYEDDMSKEEEERGKLLYEQLRTRYNDFNFEDNSFKNNKKYKKKYKSLSKDKKRIPSQYKLIATPQQISEFDYNIGKSFVNGNLRYLTSQQKEKLAYIAELNLFNSIDKLNEKNNILKEIKTGRQKGKKILMPIDIFKYDAKKWELIAKERNKNLNNIAIHQLNDENKKKLNNMKEYLNQLNTDAFIADKEVNKTINRINDFLIKYGVDSNVSRRNSSISSIRKVKK